MGAARFKQSWTHARLAIRTVLLIFPLTHSPQAGADGIARLDPMYVAVFGGGQAPLTKPGVLEASPATGKGTSETRRVDNQDTDAPVLGHWQLAAGTIAEFDSVAAESPAATISVDDLRFRPRLVAASNTGEQVAYALDSRSRVWSADFYGSRPLAQSERTQLRFLAGFKLGGIEGDSATTLNGHSASDDEQAAVAQGILRSSATTGTLAGPMFGIAGSGRLERHRFAGVFQQSMLFGSTELARSAEFGDSSSGIDGSAVQYIEGRDVNVSVSELGLKYLYDLADNVSLGLGAMASVWWDAPSAQLGDGGGREDETLVYLGGLGSIEVQF